MNWVRTGGKKKKKVKYVIFLNKKVTHWETLQAQMAVLLRTIEAGAVGEVSKSLCRMSPELFSAAVSFFNNCFALENNQKIKLESQKAKSGAVCYPALLGSKSSLAGHSFAIGTKGTHKKTKRAPGYLSAHRFAYEQLPFTCCPTCQTARFLQTLPSAELVI